MLFRQPKPRCWAICAYSTHTGESRYLSERHNREADAVARAERLQNISHKNDYGWIYTVVPLSKAE